MSDRYRAESYKSAACKQNKILEDFYATVRKNLKKTAKTTSLRVFASWTLRLTVTGTVT